MNKRKYHVILRETSQVLSFGWSVDYLVTLLRVSNESSYLGRCLTTQKDSELIKLEFCFLDLRYWKRHERNIREGFSLLVKRPLHLYRSSPKNLILRLGPYQPLKKPHTLNSPDLDIHRSLRQDTEVVVNKPSTSLLPFFHLYQHYWTQHPLSLSLNFSNQ